MPSSAVFCAVFLGDFSVETMAMLFAPLVREVGSVVTVLVAAGVFFVFLLEETSLTDARCSEFFALGFEANFTAVFEPDSTFRTEDVFPEIALVAMEFTLLKI